MGPNRVWAITTERLHNYLLPRNCPRVTFYAAAGTSTADRERFLSSAGSVVAIERRWYPALALNAVPPTRIEQLARTPLSIYEFDPQPFREVDPVAGYYAAEAPVIPVWELRQPSALHAFRTHIAPDGPVRLRVFLELWRLREAVATSTLAFSIIRFRNAGAPPDGFTTAFLVPR